MGDVAGADGFPAKVRVKLAVVKNETDDVSVPAAAAELSGRGRDVGRIPAIPSVPEAPASEEHGGDSEEMAKVSVNTRKGVGDESLEPESTVTEPEGNGAKREPIPMLDVVGPEERL